MSDYLLLAASVDCLSDKILYDKAFELVSEARRKKADSYRLEEDRRRSLAAGVLLNQAVRLWNEDSGQENSAQKRSLQGKCVRGESGHRSRKGCGSLQFFDLREAIENYDSKFDYPVETKENGKPAFLGHPEIYFNLSHAGNYVVCVVAQCEVGVDVEGNRNVRPSIEKRFFSEDECRWVQAADSEKLHSERFFRLWTLKEAYSKLTGEGISYGIGKAHFEVPLGDNLVGKELERKADFYEYRIGDKYYVAVAVEAGNGRGGYNWYNMV